MAKETDRVRRFLEHFAAWAERCPLILGVALVGSYARNAFREDSDIDLVIVTEDKTRTLQVIRHEFRFEDIVDARTEEWGMLTSLRVFYASGLEVEYGAVTEAWVRRPLDPGTKRVVREGFRVLLDRSGVFAGLPDDALD